MTKNQNSELEGLSIIELNNMKVALQSASSIGTVAKLLEGINRELAKRETLDVVAGLVETFRPVFSTAFGVQHMIDEINTQLENHFRNVPNIGSVYFTNRHDERNWHIRVGIKGDHKAYTFGFSHPNFPIIVNNRVAEEAGDSGAMFAEDYLDYLNQIEDMIRSERGRTLRLVNGQ